MTVAFRNREWSSRIGAMGDAAESVFELIHSKGWVRYGLKRPPLQVHKLPVLIRYSPDYLTTACFVEVQGFGRDQVLKLKIDKWLALQYWATLHPVELFVWDSANKRWCFITLAALTSLIEQGAELRHFSEGKTYLAFGADVVFEASHRQGPLEDERDAEG